MTTCNTFTISSATDTVTLIQPIPLGADDAIKKHIDRTAFWSGNYVIDDDGIATQPLRLQGIETDVSQVTLTDKMRAILDMADDNEEVTIAGLGDCLDGVYVIKQFTYTTVRGAIKTYAWNITLEKV